MLLVDLMLDCFCALLVPAEHSPALPVSPDRAQAASRNIFVGGRHA